MRWFIAAAMMVCVFLPATAGATPTANFSISASPTQGKPTTFTNTSSCDRAPCTYRWTDPVDNQLFSTSSTGYSFTYNGTGSRSVNLRVTNRRGQSANRTRSFTVAPAPPPPPTDTDGDGVPDSSDGCPNDPGPASNNGCPVPPPPTDTDGDGVPDDQDACPNDPGPASNQGCPISGGGVTITDTVDGFPVSHTFAEQPGRTNTGSMTPLSSGAPCGQVDSGTYNLTDRDITCRIWLPRASTATVNISQSVMHACAQNQILGQGGTVNLNHVDVDQRACNDEPAVSIEGTGSMKHSTVVHSSNPLRLGGQNIVVDGNWFHDFQSAEDTAHTDGLEIYGGHDQLVENNFWTDVTGSAGANSVIFVQVNGAGGAGGSCCANITLQGNTLGTGGSRPLFLSCGGGSCGVGPVNVIDNRFTSTNVYPQGGWDATTTEGGTSPGFGTFTGNTILVQRTGQLCRVEANNSWSVNESGPDACASGPA